MADDAPPLAPPLAEQVGIISAADLAEVWAAALLDPHLRRGRPSSAPFAPLVCLLALTVGCHALLRAS